MPKNTLQEIEAMHDWLTEYGGLSKDSAVVVTLRRLQAYRSEAKRLTKWWEEQVTETEELMDAIEQAAGIEGDVE